MPFIKLTVVGSKLASVSIHTPVDAGPVSLLAYDMILLESLLVELQMMFEIGHLTTPFHLLLTIVIL